MKYVKLLVISLFLIGSASAWATPSSMSFQNADNWWNQMDIGQNSGQVNITSPASGLSSASCFVVGPPTCFSASLDIGSGFVFGDTTIPSITGDFTVDVAPLPDAYPDPLPSGAVIKGTITGGSGSVGYYNDRGKPDTVQGVDYTGTLAVDATNPSDYMSPAFLTDMGFSASQTNWVGTFNADWNDPLSGGADASIELTDPMPDPTPEAGTLTLLALGLATMALACGRRACTKQHGSADLTGSA